LRFSSSIPICSKDITKAISQSLNITPEKAEKLKYDLNFSQTHKKQAERSPVVSRKDGTTTRGKGEKVFKAIEPILNNLCDQVKKYINYYRTYGYPEYPDSKNKKMEEVILCGKEADLKGLSDFFSAKLGIPVKLAKPWLNIVKKEVTHLSSNESLRYITALGLALRGVEENND